MSTFFGIGPGHDRHLVKKGLTESESYKSFGNKICRFEMENLSQNLTILIQVIWLLTGAFLARSRLRVRYLSYSGRTQFRSCLEVGRPKVLSSCSRLFCTASFSSTSCSRDISSTSSGRPHPTRLSLSLYDKQDKYRSEPMYSSYREQYVKRTQIANIIKLNTKSDLFDFLKLDYLQISFKVSFISVLWWWLAKSAVK